MGMVHLQLLSSDQAVVRDNITGTIADPMKWKILTPGLRHGRRVA